MAPTLELDDRPGWNPMNDNEQMRIRESGFTAEEIPSLIVADPYGLLELLRHPTYVVTPVHLQLATALREAYYDHKEDAGFSWSELETSIALRLANYEEKPEIKVKDQQAYEKAKRLDKERRDKEAAWPDNVDVALGRLEEFRDEEDGTAPLRIEESVVEETKIRAHLGHCAVDLATINTKWAPPFSQREPDMNHSKDLLNAFLKQGIRRACRSDSLIITMTKDQFRSHVEYTWQQRVAAGLSNDDPGARAKFESCIKNPAKEVEMGVVAKYEQLEFLLLDGSITPPTLEAGMHRRAALQMYFEQTANKDEQNMIRDWKPEFTLQKKLDLVRHYRSFGVIILDWDIIGQDISFLSTIRANPHVAYKDASHGDWVKNFFDLWKTFGETKKAQLIAKSKWVNELCVMNLGMHPTKDKSSQDSLRTIASAIGLHRTFRLWISFLPNRAVVSIYWLQLLVGAKMAPFVDSVLETQVKHQLWVFGVDFRESVTSQDVALINRCITYETTAAGNKKPTYNKDQLMNLFFPADPDDVTKARVAPLPCMSRDDIDQLIDNPHLYLAENVPLRGARRNRRPNFLRALDGKAYDNVFVRLLTKKTCPLADEVWMKFVCVNAFPIFARAIVVLIWMFDPNHQYPYSTNKDMKNLDLEDILLDAVGWKENVFAEVDLTDILDDKYEDQTKENFRELKDSLRSFMSSAFSDVCQVLMRKGGNIQMNLTKVTKEWKTLFHIQPPNEWVGNMTQDDQARVARLIRNSEFVMVVLKRAKKCGLPFMKRAQGLGKAIATIFDDTSGIDYFGESKDKTTWKYLHPDFASWYRSQSRIPHEFMSRSALRKDHSVSAAQLVEVVCMSKELEFCVSRLCRTNGVRFVRNASDPAGSEIVSWCSEPDKGCTSESEFVALKKHIAFLVLGLHGATGYSPAGIALNKLQGDPVTVKQPTGKEAVTMSDVDYSQFDRLVKPSTFEPLPHKALNVADGFRFPNNPDENELPELDYYVPPHGFDSYSVLEYKKARKAGTRDRRRDPEDPDMEEAQPALPLMVTPRRVKRTLKDSVSAVSDGVQKRVADEAELDSSPLAPRKAARAGLFSYPSATRRSNNNSGLGANGSATNPDFMFPPGQQPPRPSAPGQPAPTWGPHSDPQRITVSDIPKPLAPLNNDDKIMYVRRAINLDERDARTYSAWQQATAKNERSAISMKENKARHELVNTVYEELGFGKPGKSVWRRLQYNSKDKGKSKSTDVEHQSGKARKSTARSAKKKEKQAKSEERVVVSDDDDSSDVERGDDSDLFGSDDADED